MEDRKKSKNLHYTYIEGAGKYDHDIVVMIVYSMERIHIPKSYFSTVAPPNL